MSNTKLKQKCVVFCVWCMVVLCVVGWIVELENTTEPTTENTTEFTYYTSRELGVLMQAVIDVERVKGVNLE